MTTARFRSGRRAGTRMGHPIPDPWIASNETATPIGLLAARRETDPNAAALPHFALGQVVRRKNDPVCRNVRVWIGAGIVTFPDSCVLLSTQFKCACHCPTVN